MSAIVTDQFRINNAGNFLGDVNNSANSYYVFVGLSNPGIPNNPNAFGRNESVAKWNQESTRKKPIDNINYLNHVRDTMIFGKKITSDNIRRVVRKINWVKDTTYDMYRHDYSSENEAPNGRTSWLLGHAGPAPAAASPGEECRWTARAKNALKCSQRWH